MNDYRFIEPETMTPLARLLDGLSTEMLTIRSALPNAIPAISTTLTEIASSSQRTAAFIRAKAALMDPHSQWRAAPPVIAPTWDTPNGLGALIDSNRTAVGVEMRRVAGQLNRLSSFGIRS